MNSETRFKFAATLATIVTIVLLIPTLTFAQFYDYQPVGARSIGMGGTGVASARGGEAIYHNPALMGWNETYELSLSFRGRWDEIIRPSSRYDEGNHLGTHLASLVVPMSFKDNMISLGIAHSRPIDPVLDTESWGGGIDMYSPALSIRVHDRVRLGTAINFWTGSIHFDGTQIGPVTPGGWVNPRPDEVNYEGLNTTIGGLFTLLEYYQMHKLYLGATLRTGFNLESKNGTLLAMAGEQIGNKENSIHEVPASVGIGLAWIIHNRTTISLDIARNSMNQDFHEAARELLPEDETVPDWMKFNQSMTHFSIGSEYVLDLGKEQIPLRMGFAYYDTPFKNKNGSSVKAEALSIGAGLDTGVIRFDFAYKLNVFVQHAESYVYYYDDSPYLAAHGTHVSYKFRSLYVSATVNFDDIW